MNKTQSNQNGCIRKKGNQWYYRFRMEEADGSWKQHEFKGGSTKRETIQMLKDALEDYCNTGHIYSPGNITVNELANLWYQSEIENSTLTTNGRKDYQNIMRHIREHSLGSTKLRDLTCELLQNYVDEKYYGSFDENGKQIKHAYSDSHMRKQFVVLTGMFKFAVYPKHLLRENPMQYIRKRKKEKRISLFGEHQDSKVETITTEEFQILISFLLNDEKYHYLALPVQIAFYTGMRAGEVCGLTWEDIDLQNQCINVRRSMYYDVENECWELKVPKSGKPRTVDFGNQLTAILKKARKEQMEAQMRYGVLFHKHYYQQREIKGRQHVQIFSKIHEDITVLSSRCSKGRFLKDADPKEPLIPVSFVCFKPDGELLTTQTLKWCNKVIQKELPELQHFHFHCLRHTYASTLVNNGANVKDVQELLGHSDIKITLNTYSHVTSASRKKAVGIFENAIGK